VTAQRAASIVQKQLLLGLLDPRFEHRNGFVAAVIIHREGVAKSVRPCDNDGVLRFPPACRSSELDPLWHQELGSKPSISSSQSGGSS